MFKVFVFCSRHKHDADNDKRKHGWLSLDCHVHELSITLTWCSLSVWDAFFFLSFFQMHFLNLNFFNFVHHLLLSSLHTHPKSHFPKPSLLFCACKLWPTYDHMNGSKVSKMNQWMSIVRYLRYIGLAKETSPQTLLKNKINFYIS